MTLTYIGSTKINTSIIYRDLLVCPSDVMFPLYMQICDVFANAKALWFKQQQ